MNFYQHLTEIGKIIDKYCRKEGEELSSVVLLLSLRYSQIIDNESLSELAGVV